MPAFHIHRVPHLLGEAFPPLRKPRERPTCAAAPAGKKLISMPLWICIGKGNHESGKGTRAFSTAIVPMSLKQPLSCKTKQGSCFP